MRAVLGVGNLGRRLAESVIGLFAILGFVYVPLGRRTGFEHACAVLSTPAAAAAIEDVSRTALQLRTRVLDFLTQRAAAGLPPTPAREPPSKAEPPRKAGDLPPPRPVPPKLR